MKLWPFASKQKALEHHLVQEIKQLQEKLEDNDFDEELREIESKSFQTTDASSSLSGIYGVVDEFYDKAHLQRLYATETWFFIAVHTIAKTIASLPIKLEKRKKIQQNITQSDGSVDKIQKETWIDASAEPEYDILTHPNGIQSSVEFWMLVIIDLMASGDAFIFVDKGEVGESELEDENTSRARLRQSINKRKKTKVRGMYRLSSGLVKPQPSKSDTKVLGGYQINTEYGVFNFEVDEVIHIRLPNPNDPFFGLSPIIPVMKNLLLDKYSAEHMIRFYKQGARLGGVIETGKKLTKDQLTRLERVFESNFTGKRNHHKTLILPEGMKYTTIEQNPGATSLIEFLKANKEPVLAAYNMPPVKVGLLDGATFANAMIQDKTYYNDTIKPICKILQEAINQHGTIISKFRELRFSFSFDEIEALKENETEKATTARGMLDAGMSINEVREKVWKLPPISGLDGTLVPAIEKLKNPMAFMAPVAENPEAEDAKPADGVEDTEAEEGQGNPNGVQNVKPKEVLNGAQITSMVTLLQSIDDGTITRESALGILEIGFNLTREQALKVVGNAEPDPAKVEAEQEATAPKTEDEAQKKTEESKINPYTKEFLIDHLKTTTGEGVEPLIEERLQETREFFKRLEKFLTKKAKDKTKSFKVKSDEEITELDLVQFLRKELGRLYESDKKAMRHGYKSSISSRPMTFPNIKAHAKLKEVGAQHITSITNTTRKQINKLMADSFAEQVDPGEMASRIRDVFDNISSGRAMTIARTETLTAVSLGQDLKAQEFKEAYPKEAARMKRIWVSAQDERVRDTHVMMDGEMVEVGEPFPNGLKFPRDPDGDASEIINCRCTSIEYLPEDEEEIQSTLANSSPLAAAVDEAE